MSIFCLLAGHKAVASNIWNDGYYFSRCRNCDCELIGRWGEWRRVPRGYKVVWRPRTETTAWVPWSPAPAPDGARLSDLVEAVRQDGVDGEFPWSKPAMAYRGRSSVVESLHVRAAAG